MGDMMISCKLKSPHRLFQLEEKVMEKPEDTEQRGDGMPHSNRIIPVAGEG